MIINITQKPMLHLLSTEAHLTCIKPPAFNIPRQLHQFRQCDKLFITDIKQKQSIQPNWHEILISTNNKNFRKTKITTIQIISSSPLYILYCILLELYTVSAITSTTLCYYSQAAVPIFYSYTSHIKLQMQITFASEEFHEFMKTKMLVMMPLI